jgi:hypothetical protein
MKTPVRLTIDGGRFFPTTCIISRVVCRVFNIYQENPEPPDLFPELNTTMALDSSPNFPTFINSYRIYNKTPPPSAQPLDPTLIALFKIYAFDTLSNQLVLLGISFLNFFIDPQTKTQPANENVVGFALNEGAHQLPVYILPKGAQTFPKGIYVGCVKERVPCATLLVRLTKEKWTSASADEVSPTTPMAIGTSVTPLYEEGMYDNRSCLPLETVEMQMLPFLVETIEETRKRMIREALAEKGEELKVGKDSSDDEMQKWIIKTLATVGL